MAELKGLARTLPNQSILINAIVLKEAQASSDVENIITTHDKLYQAMLPDEHDVVIAYAVLHKKSTALFCQVFEPSIRHGLAAASLP